MMNSNWHEIDKGILERKILVPEGVI